MLVPPMSKVMQWSMPAISHTRNAPFTPPTGPLRNVRTTKSFACASDIAPPFEPMMLTGAPTPLRASSAVRVSR